jgi:hypothetical protein
MSLFRCFVLVALASGFTLVACGEETAPLALDQRVLTETELPGFKATPNPVQRWTDATKFATDTHDQDIRTTVHESTEQLETGGFVAAIANSFDSTSHKAGAFSAAIQMGSEDDAQQLVDQRHQDYTSPCPDVCTVDASEFEVSGIPDAKGVKRASQPGHEGEPFEAYEVEFADGDFAYVVNVTGEPGSVSKEDALAAAQKLYNRVKGAPLPGD